jgi:gliding motility-associated-like protein
VPDGLGYSLIKSISNVNTTSFTDDNNGEGLIPGLRYCYLVTKYFGDESESYASNEACAIIKKITPILTYNSILLTDENNGEIKLGWSPPNPFDSVEFPPPYRYIIQELQPADGVEVLDSTLGLSDTNYTLGSRNTRANDFRYRVELYSYGNGKKFIGRAVPASSVFLTIAPSDNLNALSWTDNTPWFNSVYRIYRRAEDSPSFSLLDSTVVQSYVDRGLSNGKEYCYYIESSGSYSLASVDSPLVNLSQIACGVPVDNIAPCSPSLSINAICEDNQATLKWIVAEGPCRSDISFYNILYAKDKNSPYDTIAVINDTSIRHFEPDQQEVSGCYQIATVDSAGNPSTNNPVVCVPYCPVYELPNVFTPNGDYWNNFFAPIKNPDFRHVDSINLRVYNRWDQLIFQTKDPEIKWDGRNANSNEMSSEGVYFYICEVFEKSVDSTSVRILKGTITIADSKPFNNTD